MRTLRVSISLTLGAYFAAEAYNARIVDSPIILQIFLILLAIGNFSVATWTLRGEV